MTNIMQSFFASLQEIGAKLTSIDTRVSIIEKMDRTPPAMPVTITPVQQQSQPIIIHQNENIDERLLALESKILDLIQSNKKATESVLMMKLDCNINRRFLEHEVKNAAMAPAVIAPIVTAPIVTAPVVSAPIVSTPVVSTPVVSPIIIAPIENSDQAVNVDEFELVQKQKKKVSKRANRDVNDVL
jgi:hypothetical protein